MADVTSRLLEPGNGRPPIRVYEGGDGPELLYLHGAGGLLPNDPFLAALADRFRVSAPLLPGYEDSEGADELRDMLDVALHTDDVRRALGLNGAIVVGHSMGGMIAAEMAALAPDTVRKLALICPAGLWLDEHPIPDLFAKLPFELPELLFHDVKLGESLLTAGLNFDDEAFLTQFLIMNARRFGMAGKLLFPIPDRGLSQRLHRVTARTVLLWGAEDKLIVPAYGEAFRALMPNAELVTVPEAGHLVTHEKTGAVLEAIGRLA